MIAVTLQIPDFWVGVIVGATATLVLLSVLAFMLAREYTE